MGEGSSEDNGVRRAVTEDSTELLVSATRLLHLACKHDAVERARLLLEGGRGITACPVDARDQLTRTPLHVAAEMHSARCQVERSLDNSIEDFLFYLQEEDLKAVKLLAEKTGEVGEVAYIYAMEGRVTALAMLLLVIEDKISAPVSVVVDGVRTKRSIYDSLVDEVSSIGDASARDGNDRRKALLCEIQLLNQFGASSWRDGNIDRRTLPPLLRTAKVGDVSFTKILLMGDVDNETEPEGNTVLHWCLSGSSSTQEPRIVWLLLKNGAKVFQGNKLGLTPVHIAAAKGNYKALQSLLLHAKDCVDIPSKTKETPLFFAVKNGDACSESNIQSQHIDECSRAPHPKSDCCIICGSYEAPMELVRCLHKIRDACMTRRNVRACMICGSSASGVKSSAALDAKYRYVDKKTLFVDSSAGRLCIEISMNEMCMKLRKSIEERLGHSIQHCTLRVGSRIMDSDRTLQSYGLSRYSVIQLHPNLLGGSPNEPPAKRICREQEQTLIDYINSSQVNLFTTKNIPSINNPGQTQDIDEITSLGRTLGRSLVDHFFRVSKVRKTWNGQIGLQDFIVIDGRAVCTKKAIMIRTNLTWAEDMKQLATILRGIFPAHERHFYYLDDLLQTLDEAKPALMFAGWYKNYITTHLSFKSSIRRGNVAYDINRMYEDLDSAHQQKFKFHVNQVPFRDWTQTSVRRNHVFLLTWNYYLKKHNKPYESTSFGCLTFLRSYGAHAQKLPWDLTEYAIPYLLGDFLCHVIKKLLQENYPIDKALNDD